MSERIPVRVISMTTAVARRETMAAHLDALGLDWAFFDACTGGPENAPPYDEALAKRRRGRTLARGELGCFQSHYALWQQMIASGDAWWLILEDDHLLDASFDVNEMAETASRLGVHYVRLSSIFLQKFVLLGMFGERQLVRFRSGPYGSGAYLISREGARRLVDSIPAIVRPIDDELDSFWLRDLPPLAVFPPPTLNVGLRSSTIAETGARPMGAQSKADRLRWILTRARRKLRKEIANVASVGFDRETRRRARALAPRTGA